MLPMHVLPAGHALPHCPQFCVSVVVSLHPLAQHDLPGPHAGPPLQPTGGLHMLPTHVSPGAQAFPQAPQFCVSRVVSVHPVMQHDCPGAHCGPPLHPVITQRLPEHVAPSGQVLPQPPQFCGSLVVSLHPLVQHVWPGTHCGPPLQPVGGTQRPPEHAAIGGHAMPQPPQLRGSLPVSTSQPSRSVLLQSAKPGLHDTIAHWLDVQPTVAFGTCAHTLLQPPQLFGSLVVFAQAAPQHVRLGGHVPPGPHAPAHTPPEHVSPGAHA